MENVSAYQLALVIGGFLVGSAFVIAIFKMLDSGQGRRRRHHDRDSYRYHRDAYDDERSNLLPIILILILLGIGGVALAQKMGVFQTPDGGNPDKPGNVLKEPTDKPTDSLSQAPLPDQDTISEQYAPLTEEPIIEAPILDNEGEFYILVCKLTPKDNVNAHCNGLKALGLRVCTMPKGKDTGVYVGPYSSREQAQRVNETKGLGGSIEAY